MKIKFKNRHHLLISSRKVIIKLVRLIMLWGSSPSRYASPIYKYGKEVSDISELVYVGITLDRVKKS